MTFRLRFSSATLAAATLALGGCGVSADFDAADDVDLNGNPNNNGNDGDGNNNNDDGGDLMLRGFVRATNGMGLADVLITKVSSSTESGTEDGGAGDGGAGDGGAGDGGAGDGGAGDDEEPWSTTSSQAGTFELPDLEDGETIVVSFELEGYAPTNGAYTATEGGLNFFSHTLAPVDLDTEFPSEAGISFELDGTHSFTIPAATVQYLDGTPYTGTVGLQATVWDRTTSLDEGGEFLASPGDGNGTMNDGSSHLLYTMGMFQLAMQDEQGEPLEAGPGFQMAVQVPANTNLPSGSPVPFWNYNGQQNTWEESSQGEITTLPGGEQVWEFEPTQGLPAQSATGMVTGNPDYPIIVQVTAQAQGQVTDQQGNPQPGATVRVVAEDLTFMQSAVTDANGNFSVNVPPVVAQPSGPNGRPVFFEVDYMVAGQPALFRTDPVAAPGPNQVLQFGDADLGSQSCVAGSVVDLDGNGVAGVEVLSPHGGNGVTDALGNFEIQVSKWQPSTLYVAPQGDSTVGYEPMTFRPEPDGSNACPTAVTLTQYAKVACAAGEVTIGGFQAEGLIVDAFDARYPSAPIFSTRVDAGDYCVTVPTDKNVIVRVGAGDLAAGNACGSHGVYAYGDDGEAVCGGGWCEEVPTFECGAP